MDQKRYLTQLIQFLQEVQERPRMYFSEDTPPVLCFLEGIKLASFAMDLQSQYFDTYHEVQTALGYPVSALHAIDHMIKEGMPEGEVITKALELEIKTWEQILNQLESDLHE